MKFIFAEIAKSQMHHPSRRRVRDDPVRKIRVFADDDQILFPGKFPNLLIGWIPTRLGRWHDGKLRRKTQPRGQVFLEEKALHAVWTTEK